MDIKKYVEEEILEKYEYYNYGHALEILHDAFPTEWHESGAIKQLKTMNRTGIHMQIIQ